jgi:SAM-dependent methyltransferase
MGDASRCRICGNDAGNRTHVAREMMFGWRDEFEYVECGRCGCLQIATVPEDLARYYPEGYYSFAEPERHMGRLERVLRRARACHAVGDANPLGWLVARARGVPDAYRWFRRTGVGFESDILDVGSGSGALLVSLRDDGFRRLTGVDPFLDANRPALAGITLRRQNIAEIDTQHDLVMMHHAFEHVPDPLSTLQALRRAVKAGHFLLLRIPVVSSFAWRTYGVDWVQLDAPRHLFLHSRTSLGLLAEQAGFQVAHVEYDSTDFQFWGSEQYRRGISLRDLRSYAENPATSIFSPAEIALFRARARELNTAGDGDSACFYLQRPAYTG